MNQAISVLGAALILAAYAGAQLNRFRLEDIRYSVLNLGGAVLLGYVAVMERQAGFILLELVWIAVTVAAVLRAGRPSRSKGGTQG